MYNYCEPDEYIHSDIGHHFLNLRSSNKIYVAGGYFEMCQQNTVTDSIQSMALNPSTKKITIMQVLDAVFSVAQEKRFDDPFYPQLYDLQQSRTLQTGKFTVSLSEMLDLMSDPNIALEYLSRRINRMPLPSGWGVSLVYKNKVLKLSSAVENKEIVFEFLSADELKSTEN